MEPLSTSPADFQEELWELRLYVAGQTVKSVTALTNLKRYCEQHLAGRYRLEVIDLLENPQLAEGDQILAIPTLVRTMPAPNSPHYRRPLQSGARAGRAGPTGSAHPLS